MPNLNWENFHSIISELKLQGYTWREISKYLNENYDVNLSPEAYRKREQRYLKNKLLECQMDSSQELQLMMDLQVEHYTPLDYVSQANTYMKRMSREKTCIDIATMFANKMSNTYKFPMISPLQINDSNSDKEGILCISDWHYGIVIDNYNNKYDTEIAKKRITELLNATIGYIKHYKLRRLFVVNLGDMIAGRIHSQIKMGSRIDSVTQIMEVSELIANFLYELSKFTKIEYYEVLDNHSRLEPNIKESLELESLARIIGFYLKQRLKTNINICINDNDYGLDIATFSIFNHKVAGVHGDKDKQKTVINSLTMYTHNFYDLILTAHLHHFSADESNKTVRISNGAMQGTDSFAQKLRLDSKPSQTLIISTAENVVYAIHKIDLK